MVSADRLGIASTGAALALEKIARIGGRGLLKEG